MTIVELGALGELLGAIAVMGSLVYVGRQLNQSNKTAKAESARANILSYNAEFLTPIADPERMQLFRAGLNHFETLDRNAQAAFHAQIIKVFNLGMTDFALQRAGMVTEMTSAGFQRWCAMILRTPGLDTWWEGTKLALVPDYVEYLEALRDAEPGPSMVEAVRWYGPDEGARG